VRLDAGHASDPGATLSIGGLHAALRTPMSSGG